MMGMELARVAYTQGRRVTPWDALLEEVHSLAGQVAWLEDQIARSSREAVQAAALEGVSVDPGEALRPGGLAFDWVVMRDARGDRLAKVAKMAIDAGVAERMIQQVELSGRLLFDSARLGLEQANEALSLSLTPEQCLAVVTAIARQAVLLERRQNGMELDGRVIEGE